MSSMPGGLLGGRQHGAMLLRLIPRLAPLLIAAVLPVQALAQPLALVECRALRERRNQLAAEAMQAEIALVLATRRRLCPQQEALAEQANANTMANPNSNPKPDPDANGHGQASANDGAAPAGTAATELPVDKAGSAARVDLDYTRYLECRRQAEQRLRRSRMILYTNQRGFLFYTVGGARLARAADAVQQRLGESCAAADGG